MRAMNNGGLRNMKSKVLFVNACVRKNSRTKRIADYLLLKLNVEITEVKTADISFPAVDEAFLKKRDSLIASSSFDDPLFEQARLFADADEIVIAAPYWDMSFPASLKQYIEQINVLGVTFSYTSEGTPRGLCKAKRLYYVTAAGGTFVPEDYGFGYVKTLAQSFYGIPEVKLIQAAGLDIYGADEEQIVRKVMDDIDGIVG